MLLFFFNNNFLNLILKSFLKNKFFRLKHKRFNFRLIFIIYIVLNKEVPTKLFFLRYQNFLTKTLKIFYQLS